MKMFEVREGFEKLFKDAAKFFKTGNPKRASALFQQYRPRMSREEQIESFLIEGEGFSRFGRWNEAENAYREALRIANHSSYETRRIIARRYYFPALFERACVLARVQRVTEAKELFHQVARAMPSQPEAYEWLGGILLVEDSDRAAYFLRKAWLLGGGAIDFLRNLFIVEIIQREYEEGMKILPFLCENGDFLCERFQIFLPALKARPFNLFCQNFVEFIGRLSKRRVDEKTTDFLERLKTVVGGVQEKTEELRKYIIPLAHRCWDCGSFDALSYYECLKALDGFAGDEIKDFSQYYRKYLDAPSYGKFISSQQKNPLRGVALLTFSQVLELLLTILEELGREVRCTVFFNQLQKDPFRYRKGRITFGGSLIFIEDEHCFKESLKQLVMMEDG